MWGSRITRGIARHRTLSIIVAVLLSMSAVVAAGVYEAHTLRLTRVTYYSPKVPAAFDGLRVAFLSDFHLGLFTSRSQVREAVDLVMSLHPDLIVLGGDYASYQRPQGLKPMFQELSRLRAPLGVYAVYGNHDLWLSKEGVAQAMKDAGVQLLDNSGVWLEQGGDRIRLSGFADLIFEKQDFGATLADATASDFVLAVSHDPDIVERFRSVPVDLLLSGHTHGGQISLFGLWAPFNHSEYGQTYLRGVVTTGPVPVVITNGIGTTLLPLRLFAPPEVVLLTLESGTPEPSPSPSP